MGSLNINSMDPLITLTKQIFQLSDQLASLLRTSGDRLGLVDGSPLPPETPKYEAIRSPLNDAAVDLLRLINGPKLTLRSMIFSHYDLAAIQIACTHNFFQHVPLNPLDNSADQANDYSSKGMASVQQIADKAGIDVDRTARVMRLLAMNHIFEEVEGKSGWYKHSAYSSFLAQDDDWLAVAGMQTDELFKASSEASTATTRWAHDSNSEQSAFSAKFGVPVYEFYKQNPEKAVRFAKAMSAWSKVDQEIAELRDGFDWSAIGNGKVVDVGGGSGFASIALARRFPDVRFIVQDISPKMLAQAEEQSIADVRSRLVFEQHDFFQPQPVTDASCFLIRQCLHNYNDADCLRILRALVPAMESSKHGAILLINDIVMPDHGSVPRTEEKYMCEMDVLMMVALGAKQRSVREFDILLKAADPRFVITKKSIGRGAGLLEVIIRDH